MKNIYEILKSIGLEVPDDKKAEFDKAVLENYKTVAEADKLRTARDNYKAQLDTATQKLEDFKDVNVEELKGKIETLTGDLASQKAAFEQQIADRDFDDLINGEIRSSKAKNIKAVRALLDLDSIRASKNQKGDIAAALKKAKEENDYMFESEEPIDNPDFVGKSSGKAAKKTIEDISKMSYDEYKEYRQNQN